MIKELKDDMAENFYEAKRRLVENVRRGEPFSERNLETVLGPDKPGLIIDRRKPSNAEDHR